MCLDDGREMYQRLTQGDESNTYLVTRVEMLLREAGQFASFTRTKALAYLGRWEEGDLLPPSFRT